LRASTSQVVKVPGSQLQPSGECFLYEFSKTQGANRIQSPGILECRRRQKARLGHDGIQLAGNQQFDITCATTGELKQKPTADFTDYADF